MPNQPRPKPITTAPPPTQVTEKDVKIPGIEKR